MLGDSKEKSIFKIKSLDHFEEENKTSKDKNTKIVSEEQCESYEYGNPQKPFKRYNKPKKEKYSQIIPVEHNESLESPEGSVKRSHIHINVPQKVSKKIELTLQELTFELYETKLEINERIDRHEQKVQTSINTLKTEIDTLRADMVREARAFHSKDVWIAIIQFVLLIIGNIIIAEFMKHAL